MTPKLYTKRNNQIKDYFNARAGHWDRASRCEPETLSRILSFCDLYPGMRLLDVGCGTGVLFPWLLASEPEFVLGVDISEEMAQRARDKQRDARLAVAAADYCALEAARFDRIIIYNAYPHFFDKALFARKTHELAADGGRFIIAHSRGRSRINDVHQMRGANACSVPLEPANQEMHWFEQFFSIDIIIDTADLYIISGKKET